MCEPKTSCQIKDEFKQKLSAAINSAILRTVDAGLWDANLRQILLKCEECLTNRNDVNDDTEEELTMKIREVIQSNCYCSSRIALDSINIRDIVNATLHDWILSQEQMDWLCQRNLLGTTAYI